MEAPMNMHERKSGIGCRRDQGHEEGEVEDEQVGPERGVSNPLDDTGGELNGPVERSEVVAGKGTLFKRGFLDGGD